MFSEMGAGNGKVWLRLLIQNRIKKSNQILHHDQADSLQQTLAKIVYLTYKRIYLVWCLWQIIDKSGDILVLRVFVGLKQIIEERV